MAQHVLKSEKKAHVGSKFFFSNRALNMFDYTQLQQILFLQKLK